MGDWIDNQITSLDRKGLYLYSNGELYLGRLSEGNRHQVEGTYLYSNGDIYLGSWLHQQKQGLGKYYYQQTKDVYKG
jgi:hypothetical protein